jgi:hypothetical protein
MNAQLILSFRALHCLHVLNKKTSKHQLFIL